MAVVSISIEEAKKLSQTVGILSLDITSGLTAEVAECLIKSKSGIALNSLTILNDDVAEVLSKYPYSLQLGGARLKVSSQAIKALSKHSGSALNIHNIYEFDIEMARYLAGHKGSLSISTFQGNGLSEEALIELSKHEGDLSIVSKFNLTPKMINALLKHKGHLTLPLVENISSEIARKFKKHDGQVDLPGKTTTIYSNY